MTAVRDLPRNVYRRRDRAGRVGARIQVDGRRVRLGEWPDTPAGIAAAAEAVKLATRDLEDGAWREPSRITVGEYVAVWLERRRRKVTLGDVQQNTVEGDECRLLRVTGRLGSRRLVDLTREDVERFAVELLEDGNARGGPLAPQTVVNTLKALRAVIASAVDEGILTRDPSRGVRVTRAASDSGDFDELATWTAGQLGNLIGSLHGLDRQLIGLAAATGLRRSELCGLQWVNLDLDSGVVRVRSTVVMEGNRAVFRPRVKSRSSRRSIAIDPAVVALLRERRADQARQQLAAGELWHNPDGLVFTWDDGRPVSPEWFTKRVQAIARDRGLTPIGAHGLRHTFATISLANGVPLKTVSEALGHADIGITADIYSHVTEDVARHAAAVVGAAIFGR